MLESDDVVRLLLTKPEVRGSITFSYFFLLNFFLLYDLNSTKMQVLLACHQCAPVISARWLREPSAKAFGWCWQEFAPD